MRVLFMFLSGFSHLSPTISLAWALRSAGHEVLYTGTGNRTGCVTSAGLPLVDTAPGTDAESVMFRREADEKSWNSHLARLMDPAKIVDEKDAARVASTFVSTAALTIEGDLDIAERWKPDLIVHEPAHLGAPLVATRLGVPRVQLEIHLQGVARYFTPAFDDWLAEHHGVDRITPSSGHISMAPASVVRLPGDTWPMRYVPHNGGGVLPDWVLRQPDRPRVCVTLGTVVPGMDGLGHLRHVIEQAGRTDAEFVLAVGHGDVSGLGELPLNVRAAGWVPLRELLPGCALVVHHGGDGTICAAMAAGVPQVVIPHGVAHQANARVVEGRGLGVETALEDFGPEIVADLVHGEKHRAAAAEVRAEMHAMPTPVDMVSRLVALVK